MKGYKQLMKDSKLKFVKYEGTEDGDKATGTMTYSSVSLIGGILGDGSAKESTIKLNFVKDGSKWYLTEDSFDAAMGQIYMGIIFGGDISDIFG